MTKEQVINQIKYKISNNSLNKLLQEGKITIKEFQKADKFLKQKYKISFSAD